MNATNIFHPTKPQREGKNYFYDKDVTGVYRNQIALHIIKTKGEGFFSWFFNKPNNTTKEYEKYGFVKKFAPYDWFIGTGEYLENYENNLKQQILEHVSKIRYKNNEFAAIIDFDGNVLYHASKKVLHANIFKEKRFAHLKKFYQNLLLSKSLDGYDTHTISVQSQKVPNETKTIYSQKYKDWGWFISRGFRSSEIAPIIKQKQLTLEKKYDEYKQEILLYTIVVVFILLIITFTLTNKLSAKLYDYTTKLSQQKETLLYAQKVAHIGDWSLNVDTQKARWSKSVRDIVGIEDENQEFGPDYLQSIMHPDDVEGFTTSMNNCITLNQKHHCTYRIYRPNGQIRWIECRGVFDAEKNTVFGVIQDITERKELELER